MSQLIKFFYTREIIVNKPWKEQLIQKLQLAKMIECFGIILRIIVLDLLIISKLMLEELINAIKIVKVIQTKDYRCILLENMVVGDWVRLLGWINLIDISKLFIWKIRLSNKIVLENYLNKLRKTQRMWKDVLHSILSVIIKDKKLQFVAIVLILREKDLDLELNQLEFQKD